MTIASACSIFLPSYFLQASSIPAMERLECFLENCLAVYHALTPVVMAVKPHSIPLMDDMFASIIQNALVCMMDAQSDYREMPPAQGR